MASQPVPIRQRPDADEQPPVSQEDLDVIRERMKTFAEDRKAARPAEEVMERLLRRHPTV